MNTKSFYDVVVVGGGMIGASAALGLAQSGFSVALIEKNPPALTWQENTPYQLRVSALTRASQNLLTQLGAWEGIESRRLHAFTDMHVCEASQSASVHFSSAEIQEPNLGFVVENHVIQSAIWEQFLGVENLDVIVDETLVSVTFEESRPSISLTNRQITTSLLIGADGANSKVREFANIGLDSHSYDQCAVVGCVKTEKTHLDTCWQRYTEEGPFAYLCMDDNVSSIAWYLPLEKKDWAESLDDEAFTTALNQASGEMLGKVIEVNERGAFPLVRRHATQYVKPGLALIGDAAHTIHPQAGQGVNLGFLDVAALLEVLVKSRHQHTSKHWARFSVLRKYERWRRGDNEIVQRSMEFFDAAYQQSNGLKLSLRKLIVPIADRLGFAKKWLMSQTLNGRGEMPKLSQGQPIKPE